MSTWADYMETCMHGITEGADYHTCIECRALCEKHHTKDLNDFSHRNGNACVWKKEPKEKNVQANRTIKRRTN